jgi:hypothetical protein
VFLRRRSHQFYRHGKFGKPPDAPSGPRRPIPPINHAAKYENRETGFNPPNHLASQDCTPDARRAGRPNRHIESPSAMPSPHDLRKSAKNLCIDATLKTTTRIVLSDEHEKHKTTHPEKESPMT